MQRSKEFWLSHDHIQDQGKDRAYYAWAVDDAFLAGSVAECCNKLWEEDANCSFHDSKPPDKSDRNSPIPCSYIMMKHDRCTTNEIDQRSDKHDRRMFNHITHNFFIPLWANDKWQRAY